MDTKEEPKIIEVIGPAGAGKSSLAKAISQYNGRKLITSPPYYRRLTDFSFFVRNTLETIPSFCRIFSRKGGVNLSMRDAAWMVTLNGWHRVLNHSAIVNSILVLDEGPIFHMAFLQIYGSEVINSPSALPWWDHIYKQYSKTLDMIIYLDAPDTTLIDRIRSREKTHGVKTKQDDYAYKYLANLREKYEYLLQILTCEDSTLKTYRFDTDKVTLNHVLSEVNSAH